MIRYLKCRSIADLMLATIVTYVIFGVHWNTMLFLQPTGEVLRSLLLNISSSAVSLLGFVLAANTFLISHIKNKRFMPITSGNSFLQLVGIMKSCTWRLFFLSVSSAAATIVEVDYGQFVVIVSVWLVIYNTIALAVLIWATMAILSIRVE